MTLRSFKWVLALKCCWLCINLTIWELGLGSCLTQPEAWFARNTALPFLYFFSFPTGLLFLIVNGLLIDAGFVFDTPAPLQYTFLAMGSIMCGYLQWFYICPRLFGKRDLTLLALTRSRTGVTPIADETLRQEITSRKSSPLPFDDMGRTPLERVLVESSEHGVTGAS